MLNFMLKYICLYKDISLIITHTNVVYAPSVMDAVNVDIRGGIRRRNFKWQLYL